MKGMVIYTPKDRANGMKIDKRTANSDKGGQDRFLQPWGGPKASS